VPKGVLDNADAVIDVPPPPNENPFNLAD
jgi:hypothetical protein